MKKLNILLPLVALVLALSVGNIFAQDGTIVDVAVGNEDFSTLVELVTTAGLAETLSGEGPFTVFAPTNDAFAALNPLVLDLLANDTELLTAVLTYHVVPAQVMAADVASGPAPTVNGQELTLEVSASGAVTVDGVSVIATDVEGSNGVIHVIDQVLIPAVELPEPDLFSVEGGINIAGSSTVFPVTTRIAELYGEAGVPAEFVPNIQSVGTGGGFERFCVSAETDIANASRPIRTGEGSETASCEANGRNPIEFRVGTDALAVAVATGNEFLNDLTTDELALVFSDPRDPETGEVSAARLWSDIRPEFPAVEIVRFIPDTDSGTFDYFVEEIFEGIHEAIVEGEASADDYDFFVADDFTEENVESSATRPILLAGNTQNSADDNVLVSGIQGDPNAVGYFGFAFVQEGVRPLNINEVEPNAATVDSGAYPLARPLFIYSDASIMAEKPQVATFINFYLQNVGGIISEVGYFPASVRALNESRVEWLAATADMMMEG